MKGFLERVKNNCVKSPPGILLLVLVAFLVRVWGVTEVGLWHDEALSHFYASQSPGWLLKKSATDLNHPPLFFLLLRGWIHFVPTYSQFWVELLNVVFGSLTVWVTWLWGRLFLPWWTALAVVLIHALHPWAIHFSGELRMYALAGLSVCVLGYFSTRLMVCSREGVTSWVGWTLAALVCVYTHTFTVLFVMVSVPFVLLYGTGSTVTKTTSAGLLGLLYAPWAIPVMSQVVRVSSDYWLPPFHGDYPLVLLLFLGGWIGEKTLDFPGAIRGVLVTAGIGLPLILSAVRLREPVIRFLLALILFPVLLITLVSMVGQSVFLYRVFSPLIPVILLAAGVGYERLGFQWVLPLLVVYGFFLGWELVKFKTKPPRQYVRVVAEGIKNDLEEDRFVLHTTSYSYFPSRFYHGNHRREKLLVDGSEILEAHMTRRELNQLLVDESVLLITHGRQPPEWIAGGFYSIRERHCWERERTFCSMILEERMPSSLRSPGRGNPP